MSGIMIDSKTKLLGLLGNPVEHSVSPVLHTTLAELSGDNYAYLAFKVEEDKLQAAVDGAYALGAKGLNVTVPYKKAVMPYLCEIDPKAELVGAVNTLLWTERGYKGYNTDMPGLYRAMCYDGVALEGKNVVVIGAGGAANAVLGMLFEARAAQVLILNRTKKKAEELAKRFVAVYGTDATKIYTASYEEDYLSLMNRIACKETKKKCISQGKATDTVNSEKKDTDEKNWIAIQATSVGMSPRTDTTVIEIPEFYDKIEVGYDIIFNPSETKFMRLVQEHGGKSFNGLRMLLFQGIYAYELWNDSAVPDEWVGEVLQRMKSTMSPKENIVLVGYMGSGKTTIAGELHLKTGMEIIDTDALIEEEQGRSINEIFAAEGETSFREMETALLKRIASGRKGVILSTGGGMPLRKENREMLKELGHVFFLKADTETILERLENDTQRPLLCAADRQSRVTEMLNERTPVYEEAADSVIVTDGKAIAKIVDEILRQV